MIVRVEKKHIKGAVVESACACPIARALREQYPIDGVWSVYMDRVCRFPGGSYSLPQKAIEFMSDLLMKKPVLPFTFDLVED